METPQGEVYLVHLASRPFLPELRCTLGRETGIQRMKWTRDGWLRMEDGSNLAKTEVKESCLSPSVVKQAEPRMILRIASWVTAITPQNHAKAFCGCEGQTWVCEDSGRESACSLNKVSLLARKLTSVNAQVTVKMEYTPKVYQHSAGLILYYDNMNYLYLRKYYSETLGQSASPSSGWKTGKRRNIRIPGCLWGRSPFICAFVSQDGRHALHGGLTGESMRESDRTLIHPDSPMNTANMESLPEQWRG